MWWCFASSTWWVPCSLVRVWSNVVTLHCGGHHYAAKPIIAEFVVDVLHGWHNFVGVPHNHLVADDDIEKGDSLEVLDVVLDIGGYGARVRGDGAWVTLHTTYWSKGNDVRTMDEEMRDEGWQRLRPKLGVGKNNQEPKTQPKELELILKEKKPKNSAT
jgi:hypothetical protein